MGNRKARPGMWKCPKCHKWNDDPLNEFCRVCGHTLSSLEIFEATQTHVSIIDFYSRKVEYGWLSNFWRCMIVVDGHPKYRLPGLGLFLENGQTAGLWDVLEWLIETYPEDIFVSEAPEVVIMRSLAEQVKARGTSDPHKKRYETFMASLPPHKKHLTKVTVVCQNMDTYLVPVPNPHITWFVIGEGDEQLVFMPSTKQGIDEAVQALKEGRAVIVRKEDVVPLPAFIVDGVCRKKDTEICNLGYACDGCPYLPDNVRRTVPFDETCTCGHILDDHEGQGKCKQENPKGVPCTCGAFKPVMEKKETFIGTLVEMLPGGDEDDPDKRIMKCPECGEENRAEDWDYKPLGQTRNHPHCPDCGEPLDLDPPGGE